MPPLTAPTNDAARYAVRLGRICRVMISKSFSPESLATCTNRRSRKLSGPSRKFRGRSSDLDKWGRWLADQQRIA